MSRSNRRILTPEEAPLPLRLDQVTVMADGAAQAQLDSVSLDIYAGEWIQVTGVNGSGKSTLARMIAGIYTDWTSGKMDRGFAGMQTAPIVLQRPQAQLFGETPREEVQFALEWRGVPAENIAEGVRRSLEAVGLMDAADMRWEHLSGGQMQLAAVAAAVAGESPLLVFDEATSMLDDAHRQAVMQLARSRHREGATVVWVTQRLDEIEADDRTIALRDGKVIFDGDGRSFLYDEQDGEPPCIRCGLRLPYMAETALALKRARYWTGPLPVSDEEWRQVLGQWGGGQAQSAAIRQHAVAVDREFVDDTRKPGKRDLIVEHVHSTDGTDRLSFAAGTLTLIAGPNGAGKSWLLEKLAGLRPAEGAVMKYGAEPLLQRKRNGRAGGRRLNERALRRYGFAGQQPEQGMFMRTLAGEIAYAQRPYVGAAAHTDDDYLLRSRDEALAAVGWDEAWLARDPLRMSGGERRRAALAALFATPADWLLLDEPTAGLDRDGHDRLAQHLTGLKQAGRGIVMVSHDLEWALPLADRVLLVRPDRSLQLILPEELINNPQKLEQAGMQAPLWLRVAAEFGSFGGAWRNPAWLAEAMASAAQAQAAEELPMPDRQQLRGREPDTAGEYRFGQADQQRLPMLNRRAHKGKPGATGGHRLGRFDPRAVWLGYVLLSIGLFSLSTWAGLLAGAATVLFLMHLASIPLRRWRGILIGYSIFGIAFAALLSIDFSGNDAFMIGWRHHKFIDTLLPFARTLIVLLLGLGVVLAMTPLSLRRALVQIVPRKRRIPAWWQRIVLMVTLTIRYVPVLLAEWERFGRIFISRGKTVRRSPRAVARKLRDTSMPMLLALFRLADEVAIALESRGVHKHAQPTRGERLRWRKRDTFLAGAAALLAALMLWLG